MGIVYGVVHAQRGTRAALKVLRDRTYMPRARLEAQVLDQIGHPSVVEVIEHGILPDGRPYLVMERVDGRSLRSLANETLSPRDVTAVLVEAARAIEAAHDVGVIHRDIKPEHIIVLGRDPWRIKIIDWGVAALTEDDHRRQTSEGSVIGTPSYLSPEQACGDSVSTASDVYAFGVMAYELYLRRLPFQAAKNMDMLKLHVCAPPRPPRELWATIPLRIERLLLAMLQKEPLVRPTMRGVVAELERIATLEMSEVVLPAMTTPVPGRVTVVDLPSRRAATIPPEDR